VLSTNYQTEHINENHIADKATTETPTGNSILFIMCSVSPLSFPTNETTCITSIQNANAGNGDDKIKNVVEEEDALHSNGYIIAAETRNSTAKHTPRKTRFLVDIGGLFNFFIDIHHKNTIRIIDKTRQTILYTGLPPS
jgi:hypothetical protein